jgi:hypothetical protein
MLFSWLKKNIACCRWPVSRIPMLLISVIRWTTLTTLNFLPENSRRLKALPAWFSLKAYGAKGYQDIVEGCISRAGQLADFIEKGESFELLAPVRLNTVCFTLKGEERQDQVFEFLRILNDQGVVFMTPTVLRRKERNQGCFCELENYRRRCVDGNWGIKSGLKKDLSPVSMALVFCSCRPGAIFFCGDEQGFSCALNFMQERSTSRPDGISSCGIITSRRSAIIGQDYGQLKF